MTRGLVLAAALLASSATAHPMPNSTVELRRSPGGLEATVTMPASELEAALGRPVAGDAALEAYLRAHVSLATTDGRALPMVITKVKAEGGDHPAVTASLRVEGQSVSLRYDAVTHKVASHYALVYLDGKPLGRLQLPATTLALPA